MKKTQLKFRFQSKSRALSQVESLLESVCAGPLPVAYRLELRRLVVALCHASNVTDEPLPNTSRVDVAVAALKRFKAHLKRRTDARDGLTSKRLMDLPEDARAILLSSIASIFRDVVDDWSPSTIYGNWRRGAGILNNELYVGKMVWNRQHFVKDPQTGKRQARLNPKEKWVTQSVPDLQIISGLTQTSDGTFKEDVISIRNIYFAPKKTILENESDVDAYGEELKAALKEQIKNGKRIST